MRSDMILINTNEQHQSTVIGDETKCKERMRIKMLKQGSKSKRQQTKEMNTR